MLRKLAWRWWYWRLRQATKRTRRLSKQYRASLDREQLIHMRVCALDDTWKQRQLDYIERLRR